MRTPIENIDYLWQKAYSCLLRNLLQDIVSTIFWGALVVPPGFGSISASQHTLLVDVVNEVMLDFHANQVFIAPLANML